MTQPTIIEVDRAGAETLEILQAAPRYNRWQYNRIAPYLGRRICEVGSGIGNMSSLLHEVAPDLLVLTDTAPHYRETLRDRFGSISNITIEELTLPDEVASSRFRRYDLDTVVALNVVEHIENDVEALRSMRAMLGPGGRAVILVPALPRLFGSLDKELGHFRRYTRSSLSDRMRRAGFRIEAVMYFNLVGTVGWWFNARVRKTPRIPLDQLRLFDRLVPFFRLEDNIRLPFGQSVIAIGAFGG